jgi:hypothetical protein
VAVSVGRLRSAPTISVAKQAVIGWVSMRASLEFVRFPCPIWREQDQQ